ncbi:protein LIAT1 [Boleophthalmus pectinirostris]|uniref:protein LIAT1 n=1 Tax=Boleophthalmus pectinirostris TaxID=150288 RepID=UPI00242D1FDE|nr:protein LIAT1 [Boleophthalmus pectinirostris]
MPDDKNSKPPPQPQKKKKKKNNKKKSKSDSSTSPKDADKPLPAPASSVPPVLSTIGPPRPPLPKLKSTPKKDSERGSRKSKKSPMSLFSLVCKSGGSPVQSFLSQLSVPARESVRWEGKVDDPLMEEQRLEVYRANRRQRYLTHREMEQRETKHEK